MADTNITYAEMYERVQQTAHALETLGVGVGDAITIYGYSTYRNVELLRVIAREQPESIRDAARLVDRDIRQVHRNLAELEELGLSEYVEEGRSKRPTV